MQDFKSQTCLCDALNPRPYLVASSTFGEITPAFAHLLFGGPMVPHVFKGLGVRGLGLGV